VEKDLAQELSQGRPAEIDVNEYESVVSVFEESVAQNAARKSFTCMGKSISFSALDTLSATFGAYLQASAARRHARRVMMPNILQYPVCVFASCAPAARS